MNDFLNLQIKRQLGLKDPLLESGNADVSVNPLTQEQPESLLAESEPVAIPDPVIESFRFRKERETRRIESYFRQSANENPDQASKIERLSRETGLSREAVEVDPGLVEAQIRDERNLEILRGSPALRSMISKDPDFSRFVVDDLENLSTLETILTDADVGLERGKLTRKLGFLGEQLKSRGTDDPETIASIKEIETKLRTLKTTEGFIASAAEALGTFIEGVPEVIAKGQAGALGAGSAALLAGQAGPQALTPEEIVTVPIASAAGFTSAAGAEVFRQSKAVESGLLFQELLAEGVEEEIARPFVAVARRPDTAVKNVADWPGK